MLRTVRVILFTASSQYNVTELLLLSVGGQWRRLEDDRRRPAGPAWSPRPPSDINLQSTKQPVTSVQLRQKYRQVSNEEREMAGISGLPGLLLVLHSLPPLRLVAAHSRHPARRHRVPPR